MQITVKRLVLQSLVEKAGAIVSGGGSDILPVLKNLYFEATAGAKHRLRLVATDLDLAVIADSEMVLVEKPGVSILPARKMLEMVREAGDVDMTITVESDIATISTPVTRWTVPLMRENYPPIPEVGTIQWHEINGAGFAAGLRKVRGAISVDLDKRPELTLVRCEPSGLYATDGARLHMANVSVPITFDLPVAAVDDLVKMLRGLDVSVRVGQTDIHILFEISNNIFIATKLQAQFPSVGHIVSSREGNNLELQFARADLVGAIKRARITGDEESHRITLRLDNNSSVVETVDKSGSKCSEQLPVHWVNGPMQISTNWMYLLQAVQEMESPNVRMLLGRDKPKQKAPIIIEESNFYAIINQLRTD